MTDPGIKGSGKKGPEFRCGYAALLGRPNVGKSTLLNAILDHKVSIVTPKPQTTRHSILGILNRPQTQVIFVDTPGLHRASGNAMNRMMNRSAKGSMADADLVLFVVDAQRWTKEDQDVLERIKSTCRPAILVLNKIDLVKPRKRLLPLIDELKSFHDFEEIVPLSALKRTSIDALVDAVVARMPDGPALFPGEQITDRSEAFQIAELIREKLMWRLREEVPYGVTVELERYEREKTICTIDAIIWVAREGQKRIVIGKNGGMLKEIGTAARKDIESLTGGKVMLNLWVKVKENWADNERALRQFGYEQS